APDCLGGLANAKAGIIVKKPKHLSFQEAATIPIVYLTAYYSLNYLCRMRKGEKILIHAGTGGVGLAAISLAKHAEVEIFATAGNDKKREYLKSLGVEHVFNSRALDFKDRIMEITEGKGVDIVLNSISGKAVHQNIQCLASYGRLVEIGKTDIYQNTRIGLKPFGNNLAYFAVDIDRLLLQKTELAGEQFKELIELFNNKTFNAHPYHEYSISNVSDAFLFLSQSRHIGKVVVSMDEKEINVSPASSMEFKNEGSYLIIGGCSGLGLAIAEWMSKKGAGNLVLMSRSGAKNEEDKQKIKNIEDSGTGVAVVTGDVSDEADIKKVIKQIKDDMPALKGVIHSALVLDDAPLEEMTHERFMKAVNPKMLGTWNLHIATLDIPLDFFVMFSSISSIYGNPGQSNYAAANAFLDKLSFYRRGLGLPSNTINWGVIGEVGFVARTEKVNNILSSRGWQSFSLDESIGIFEKMLLQNFTQRMAAKIVWEE
ncbi:MAG: SDR family NAD(P)-dependent oxidoreductase, partial [Candidatus Heimdallarchaeota archaeon]|nr:SDR family NAD(P)-dependent oxidoreductase [Candidatus Heimdallarchaeota archaeon]